MNPLIEIAWLAGIIEGDGCICTSGGRPSIRVAMSDEDVVRRILRFGGHVRADRVLVSGKTMWVWTSYSPAVILSVLQSVFPLLGERRQAKATEAIEMVLHRWKWCKNGHRKIDGKACKVCSRAVALNNCAKRWGTRDIVSANT